MRRRWSKLATELHRSDGASGVSSALAEPIKLVPLTTRRPNTTDSRHRARVSALRAGIRLTICCSRRSLSFRHRRTHLSRDGAFRIDPGQFATDLPTWAAMQNGAQEPFSLPHEQRLKRVQLVPFDFTK